MRRIDAIAFTLVIFGGGAVLYWGFQWFGLDGIQAGIWTQALMVMGLLGWLGTYLFRVGTGKMTYHQQLKDYEDAVLQKRLEEMSPDELAQLQAEIEQEERGHPSQSET
ncbi:DUF3007 family protein [Spirulina subsalsa]|uniref:DUF3007 family protein n=1 Tax=Spirulina subsalsa TaxID=54311 RepID=UPI00030C2FD6|nr:DUF3007 family protein [Spirulina subsalsa]